MDREKLTTTPETRLRARRESVFRALGRDVMVLPAAPVQYASRDTDRPYRADGELFYVTGMVEPDSVAVLRGGDAPSWTLFVPERNPEAELWGGPRLGPEEARERFEPDACHPLEELGRRLPDLLAGSERVHFRLGVNPRIETWVVEAVQRGRARGARLGTGPRGLIDPGTILDELRLRKDSHEIERIRAAAALTLEGHRAAARASRPGIGEWVVQAEVEAAFMRGAGSAGFGTIVGSGPNACVLHYRANANVVGEDALVLVDAGAELGLYHGDVTRTYPASGRFTETQRRIYDLVEAARGAAVHAVRPGVPVASVHEVAVRVLVEGLLELGVLTGDAEELIGRDAYKPFYPHQTSHWLGLDVHDPGDYAMDGASRPLEPGMVLTIEPGLYFGAGGLEATEPYRGIGVRIEDDVLVTETGCENLTAALPSAAEEVEELVRRRAGAI